jgi:hypothetical protein
MPTFSPSAFAAEWSMTPALRLTYEHNDNIRMTQQSHNAVQGSTIAPRLDMGVQSAVWEIKGTAQATRLRYSGEEGLDRDDETFSVISRYKTERSSYGINASRVNDAVISGQFDDPDVGLVSVQKSRRTESIQPSWSWSITERARIQLGYQFSETSYTDGESVGLYGYQNQNTTATWSYMLSPRSQLFFRANNSKFHAPNTNIQSVAFDGILAIVSTVSDTESRTRNFMVGMGHTFSRTMQGTLMLGQRKTETERAVTDCLYLFGSIFAGCFPRSQVTDDTGITFSGDLKKQFEKFDVTAAISRDVAASGAGTDVEWDLVSVRLDRPFTARLKGTFSASGSKSRQLAQVNSATTETKYYSIQPALHWLWTREMDLNLAYRYSHLKRAEEDQAVQSRAIQLTFVYAWPKYSISR